MNIKVIEKEVLSSDNLHKLQGKIFIPDVNPIGLLHVVHGMTEHIGRYDKFMREMAEKGYICFGYDHLGHGNTGAKDGVYGFFAHENGWQLLAKDVAVFANSVRDEFGRELPYYLLGHSMGSFIVRLAAVDYITPDKLIVMGTAGPNPVANMGIFVAKVIKKIKGDRYYSKLLDSLAFSNYNKRFKDENDPKSWLTKDITVRDKYKAEAFCSFRFSVSAMQDLITLNRNCNTKQWFESCAKVCPVLLVSGEFDPVGEDSKGVNVVYDNLKSNGADVTVKLYKNCRHEILNDDCYDEVVKDIISFTKQG